MVCVNSPVMFYPEVFTLLLTFACSAIIGTKHLNFPIHSKFLVCNVLFSNYWYSWTIWDLCKFIKARIHLLNSSFLYTSKNISSLLCHCSTNVIRSSLSHNFQHSTGFSSKSPGHHNILRLRQWRYSVHIETHLITAIHIAHTLWKCQELHILPL
jgi:hypothetical protein